MPKFLAVIEETTKSEVIVEAENPDAAREMALDAFLNNDPKVAFVGCSGRDVYVWPQ